MPRGGQKKGERRGGRKPGVPNRITIERALKAEKEMLAAHDDHRKLAKDVLEEFMYAFRDMAVHHQPFPAPTDEEIEKGERSPSPVEFERWGRLTVDCAKALAPFQSPQLRAIMVTPPAPPETKTVEDERVIELQVFEHDGTPEKVIQLIPPPRRANSGNGRE